MKWKHMAQRITPPGSGMPHNCAYIAIDETGDAYYLDNCKQAIAATGANFNSGMSYSRWLQAYPEIWKPIPPLDPWLEVGEGL